MNETIVNGINLQVNEEYFSSYLYLSMAIYFESLSLKGFANWMRVQAKEENDHAMGLFNRGTATENRTPISALRRRSPSR